MTILRQLTEAESDLAARDQLILQAAEATHHLASVLAATNDRYWSLPTERLIAVLNHDVQATLELFQANTQAAQAINAVLDMLNHPGFAGRAPTETGRADIVFQDGAFVHIPAPEPAA